VPVLVMMISFLSVCVSSQRPGCEAVPVVEVVAVQARQAREGGPMPAAKVKWRNRAEHQRRDTVT